VFWLSEFQDRPPRLCHFSTALNSDSIKDEDHFATI